MDIEIRTYQPHDAAAFRALNLAWINKFFTPEEKDLKTLNNPQEYIIDQGGEILMAINDNIALGTVALISPAHDWQGQDIELAKMAVDENTHGMGIGKLLMQTAIQKCRDHQTKSIWLETNSKLIAAIKLYEKYGFTHISKESFAPSPYERADVQMVLNMK